MSTVYRKSAKGQSEIETRAHRLPPRLRGALILVDGRRSDEELAKLIPAEPQATLAHLVAEGFIEVVSSTATGSSPVDRTAGERPTERQGAPAAAGPREPSVEVLRRDVVRFLNDQLGPTAEFLAVRIERARTMSELRPLLATAAQTLRSARGSAAAQAFADRFLPEGP
ncbi:MAG TPA: hypothetical protein VFQ16_13240 [Burkholderiaceae bacterium]|nr:hypothetical protein [Burkholderiaceae bacterium]